MLGLHGGMSALLTHSKNALCHPAQTLLCAVCVFSPCMCGFSSGFQASSSKTCIHSNDREETIISKKKLKLMTTACLFHFVLFYVRDRRRLGVVFEQICSICQCCFRTLLASLPQLLTNDSTASSLPA